MKSQVVKPLAFISIALVFVVSYALSLLWVDSVNVTNGYILIGLFESLKVPAYALISFLVLGFTKKIRF